MQRRKSCHEYHRDRYQIHRWSSQQRLPPFTRLLAKRCCLCFRVRVERLGSGTPHRVSLKHRVDRWKQGGWDVHWWFLVAVWVGVHPVIGKASESIRLSSITAIVILPTPIPIGIRIIFPFLNGFDALYLWDPADLADLEFQISYLQDLLVIMYTKN